MAKPSAASRDEPKPETTERLRSVRGQAMDTDPLALDRLIHERIRLGIVSALAVNESLSFNDLKKLLRTTDGNLSVIPHGQRGDGRALEDVDDAAARGRNASSDRPR